MVKKRGKKTGNHEHTAALHENITVQLNKKNQRGVRVPVKNSS